MMAAASAMKPGLGRTSPLITEIMDFMPPPMSLAPTTIRIRLTIRVARVSNLPWPKECFLSLPLDEMWVKASTTMSLSRSESECIPSATIAALRPKMPAATFPAVSRILTAAPQMVMCRICISRPVSFIKKRPLWGKYRKIRPFLLTFEEIKS